MTQQSIGFQHYTTPPTFRVELAERPVLLDLLRAEGGRRLVLLDAPAGYGKTWLLTRWYAELRKAGSRVVWLGADPMDPAELLALMVAGFQRSGIDVGRLEGLAAQGFADVPLRAVLTALTATLEATPQPVVIFLDDLHRLGRDAVQDVLTRLVHEAPPTVRFVFSGRDLSMLPRADLRTRGELLEIGAEQLRFGRDESKSLLPLLSKEQLDRILERTEGWPVALQLARLWLQAKPERSSLLDAFSGRTTEVAEYLTEQVLADLAPDLQKVLSEVAILDALNPALVAEVTGSPDAWRRLLDEGRLEHFLVPLDAERYWFRLHHLLLDYLRARHRTNGEDLRALHARASVAFERDGDPLEAVRHAVLADDVTRAARLIERTGGWALVLFGGTVRMRALLNLLPLSRIGEFPRVQVFQAFLAVKDGELARGLRLFEAVVASGAAAKDPALARDQLIVGHLIGRYADHPVAAGELEALYREIDALPATDDIARATLLNTACLLAFGTGDMRAALEAAQRAVKEMRRIGSVLGLNYCLIHLGLAQLHLGERREAEATWREAAAMAEENFGADSGLKSIADVHLAVALHARGEVGAAAQLLDGRARATSRPPTAGSTSTRKATKRRSPMRIARGETSRTTDLIARMKRTAAARGLPRLDALAQAFKARLAGTSGSTNSRLAGGRVESDALRLARAPRRRASCSCSARSPSTARLTRSRSSTTSKPPRAPPTATGSFASSRSCAPRRCISRATKQRHSRGSSPCSKPPPARTTRSSSWTSAQPCCRSCNAPGPGAASTGRAPHGRQVLATAVTTLVRASEALDAPGTLSARELEVLVELASGAPNKVIARNLQMTENTVKFHLKNVFQKLQVRHRAEALQAARARGLLR